MVAFRSYGLKLYVLVARGWDPSSGGVPPEATPKQGFKVQVVCLGEWSKETLVGEWESQAGKRMHQ